jgi:hypothetical protein
MCLCFMDLRTYNVFSYSLISIYYNELFVLEHFSYVLLAAPYI